MRNRESGKRCADAHAQAIDGKHQRFREVDNGPQESTNTMFRRVGRVRRNREVRSGAERPTGTGQYEYPTRIGLLRGQQRFGDFVVLIVIPRVERLGTV